MGELRNWGEKNSKFLSFTDGEYKEGVFEGAKIVVKDSFGEEKEVVRYKMDGKTFDSQSVGLAEQMDDVKVGERVRITRIGKGPETRWKVEKI